eukprot:COSAG04_NODE_20594_length_390_cov_0.965636_1_plen_54_part_01
MRKNADGFPPTCFLFIVCLRQLIVLVLAQATGYHNYNSAGICSAIECADFSGVV